MHEKNEGPMGMNYGMHHDMSKKSDWITKKMIWEKLDDGNELRNASRYE